MANFFFKEKKFERKLIHDFVKQINDQYATNTFKKDEVNQVIEIVHFKNKVLIF